MRIARFHKPSTNDWGVPRAIGGCIVFKIFKIHFRHIKVPNTRGAIWSKV